MVNGFEMVDGDSAKVLDQGYIRLIESWGSDRRIVESARMSTQKGFLGWGRAPGCSRCGERDESKKNGRCNGVPASVHEWDEGKPGDEKLLRYLYANNHFTPFEMAGAIIEVKAPIMVFREWHRHRTQSYNEMSARYIPLPADDYLPSTDRLLIAAGKSKQTHGQGAVLDLAAALDWQAKLAAHYEAAELLYQSGLAAGIPKELARLALTVGRYSVMRASANLRNWWAFLKLREAPDAQWEIRQFAHAAHAILAPSFERSFALFEGK